MFEGDRSQIWAGVKYRAREERKVYKRGQNKSVQYNDLSSENPEIHCLIMRLLFRL